MKKKVLLDTSIMLSPGKFKVDIFEELKKVMNDTYDVYILDKTIDELNDLKIKAKQKDKVAANIALALIAQKGILVMSSSGCEGIVDDCLVKLAEEDWFVATVDKGLKYRILRRGIPVIELMQKKYLRIIQ